MPNAPTQPKPSLTLLSGETTVRACVREAMEQLEEYLISTGGAPPAKLIVVGEPGVDGDARAYLERLNQRFPIPLEYESVPLG